MVTVKLRNRGDDAYKPLLYGDSIIIERKIGSTGNNSFTLKNASGTNN